MISKYSLSARTYPLLFSLLPILVIGIVYSVRIEGYMPLLTSLGITGAFGFLFSQLGRDQGKKKEPTLWKEWGGSPSVQILRFSDTRLDRITKKRYHDTLKEICPIDVELNSAFEANSKEEADELYLSWTKFMISMTRDTKKYNLLFKENINYGFRRNLWGLKPFAVTLVICAMLGDFIYYVLTAGIQNFRYWTQEFFIIEILLSLLLLFWLFIVNKNWIKVASWAYAERLFEQMAQVKQDKFHNANK